MIIELIFEYISMLYKISLLCFNFQVWCCTMRLQFEVRFFFLNGKSKWSVVLQFFRSHWNSQTLALMTLSLSKKLILNQIGWKKRLRVCILELSYQEDSICPWFVGVAVNNKLCWLLRLLIVCFLRNDSTYISCTQPISFL